MTKAKEKQALEDSGKMTIKFTNKAPANNPLVGNIYEGKVNVLNKATAQRFIDLGYAEECDPGTKSAEEPTEEEKAKAAEKVARDSEKEAAKDRKDEAKEIESQKKEEAKKPKKAAKKKKK